MSTLSKSIQLGVIILALQLLGKLNFVLPRLIRKVAGRLGVSRKGGYQAAERIRELLGKPPAGWIVSPERSGAGESIGKI